MNIGILGSGTVGRTLGTGFRAHGHEVTIGGRDPAKPEAVAWASSYGAVSAGYAEAAEAGDILVNATPGAASLGVLAQVGDDRLGSKVLLDVSNALDFSAGFPPSLAVPHHDSMGEMIQRAHPGLRVVKALNTVNASVMVNPERVGSGIHDIFVAGEDVGAKAQVSDLLAELGWRRERIRDLGGIRASRGLEMYLPLWLELMGALGTAEFNIRLVGSDDA